MDPFILAKLYRAMAVGHAAFAMMDLYKHDFWGMMLSLMLGYMTMSMLYFFYGEE